MVPFEIVMGYMPEIHPSRGETSEGRVPAAIERATRLREVSETLKERWRKAANLRGEYDATQHKRQEYVIGDLVMLSTKNLRLAVPKKKMGPKYAGPFRVLDVVGTQAYRLALPSSYKIHNVFHVSLLEPWNSRAGEEPTETMPLADEEDEWEVEKIRGSRTKKGEKFYLVQWKDWPEDYNTWEHADNCTHAQRMIDEYESQASPQPKRRGRHRARK